MKVRAKFKKDKTEIKLLAEHPMESGRRKKKNGDLIPGHYITELTATHKDNVVFTAFFGPAISKDPYLKFSFKGGAKGEQVNLHWVDNQNDSKTADTVIK